MRVNWKVDEDAVNTLNRLGLRWARSIITAAQIDVVKSRHNHARQEAILHGNVDDYKESMERGDVFPMIVVVKHISGKYVIAGGNHRHAAATALGVTEFDVIVAECQEREFDLLCPALNLYVGQREDRGVRARQAAHAVIRLGISITQAAADYQVPASSVSNVVTEHRVAAEVIKHGYSPKRMSATHLRAIAPVLQDEVLFPLACELASTKLSSDEVRAELKHIKSLPSERVKVAAMKEKIQAAKRITVGGRIAHTPTRNAINRSVSTLATHIKEGATECSLQMTTPELEQVLKRLATCTRILHSIIDIRGTERRET